MQSTSIASPILTLPDDALKEIVLRLPAVKSTKPWRDVHSLATTCMRLHEWKKTKIDQDVGFEWKRVSAEVAKTTGWRDSLEKILGDFEHPSRQLFREPVLRKIAKTKEPLNIAKPKMSVNEFNATLYLNRETASLNEISWCLIVCSDKKIDINKKIELVSKLPSFLSTLKSTDRQKALRMMFNLLDKEEVLGLSLNTNGIFKKVKASLYDDEPSEALLELGLRSRGLLTSKPDLGILGFNLECIPSAERWNWVLKNVPECLNTTLSMQAMLNDPACRTQMIDRLKKLFSECAFEDQRLAFCEKVSAVYSNLCECPDGKKLAKTFTHWFLNGVIFTNSNKDRLSTRYMNTLAITNHIALVKIFFGKKEKKLLSKKMVQAIQHAIRIKADDEATSTLMALAREDIDLFKKVIIKCNIPIIKIFIDLLNNVTYTAGIDNQDSIISILFEAAKKQFLYHNETFVKTFFEMMNARLEFLAKSSKNAIDEDSSSTSESNSDVIV